jgi:hypothetical protein
MSLMNLHGALIILPRSLYEFMPYLYVVIGIIAALVLYNSYAIISGILLLTVAFMIFYMRLKSRTTRAAVVIRTLHWSSTGDHTDGRR